MFQSITLCRGNRRGEVRRGDPPGRPDTNVEARELEARIAENVVKLLEAE